MKISLWLIDSSEFGMEYRHLAHQANKTEAERICRVRFNGSLPDINNYNDHKDLKLYMINNGIQESWIGLRKINYDIPHWINSSEVSEYLYKQIFFFTVFNVGLFIFEVIHVLVEEAMSYCR